MSETIQHHHLVVALVDHMRKQGLLITHEVGSRHLPDPPRVGRHEPDAFGKKDGTAWIGEAKTGDGDLLTEHSLEQLRDFSQRVMSGTSVRCPFVLCVPKAVVDRAYVALRQAGADLANTSVIA